MSQEIPYMEVGDRKLHGRSLDGWSKYDVAMLIIVILASACAGVGGWLWRGSVYEGIGSGLFASVVLWFLLLFRFPGSYGRNYRALALVFRNTPEKVWWDENESKQDVSSVIPFEIEFLKFPDQLGRKRRLGILYHKDKNCDQLFIRARSSKLSSVDPWEQDALVQELEGIINQTLSMTQLSTGVASLRVMSPENLNDLRNYINSFGDPAVFRNDVIQVNADEEEFTDWLREIFADQLEAVSATGAAENWCLFVLTIKRRGEWRKVVKGKADDQDFYELPVIELSLNIEEALAASSLGLAEVKVLEPHDLFMLCRASWDIAKIKEFSRSCYEICDAYELLSDEEKAEHELIDLLKAKLSCWPEHRIQSVSKTVIKLDSNYASIIRITGLPKYLRADTSLALHYMPKLNVWVRRLCGGESIKAAAETNQLLVKQSAFQNLERAFLSNLAVRHPKIGKMERTLQAQAERTSQYSIAQLFNEYWVVMGIDERTVKANTREIRAQLRAQGYDVHIIGLESVHCDAFWTGALGAARM